MSNGMDISQIDRKFFWELVDEGFGTYANSDIIEAYLKMIANKLKKDTDIYFTNDSIWSISAKTLGITIPSKDITDYDSLLETIEMKLGGSNSSVREDAQLLNDMNGVVEYGPYYETDKGYWHVYDRYSQPEIFEIIYYGIYGKYHDDLAFAHDLANKYLEEVDWKSPKVFNGTVDELDGIAISFFKNGNIKIKSKMSSEFWDNINHLYSVADPKNRKHYFKH